MNVAKNDGRDAGLPIKKLDGGFDWNGLQLAQSLVTGKPLTGVYIGNIRATTTVLALDGSPQIFRHVVPHFVGCEPEAHPQMIHKVSTAVIKSLLALDDGRKWGQAPVMVEFDLCYMPTPVELASL